MDSSLHSQRYADFSHRGHVLRDLRPYVCPFENCDMEHESFRWLHDILSHMEDVHIEMSWSCPACPNHQQFSTERDFRRHFQTRHPEIASGEKVTEDQLALVARTSIRRRPRQLTHCLLCLWEPETKESITRAIYTHMASAHFYRIALTFLSSTLGHVYGRLDSESSTRPSETSKLADAGLGRFSGRDHKLSNRTMESTRAYVGVEERGFAVQDILEKAELANPGFTIVLSPDIHTTASQYPQNRTSLALDAPQRRPRLARLFDVQKRNSAKSPWRRNGKVAKPSAPTSPSKPIQSTGEAYDRTAVWPIEPRDFDEMVERIRIDETTKAEHLRLALHFACHTGDTHTLRVLLESGADVNCYQRHDFLVFREMKSVSGRTSLDKNAHEYCATFCPPLFIAVRFGCLNIARFLLGRAGVHVGATAKWEFSNTRSPQMTYNTTALMAAAGAGYTQIVSCLLDAGAETSPQDSDGQTAVIKAVRHGHLSCLEALCKAGAIVNIHDTKGMTALTHAVLLGYHGCLRILLRAHASLDHITHDGVTALGIIVAQVVDRKLSGTLKTCIQMLVWAGASITASGDGQPSPLMQAAGMCSNEVLTLLLDLSSQRLSDALHHQDRYGSLAVHIAAADGDLGCLELLIAKGASVNVRDGKGQTPLIIAAKSRKTAKIRRLLSESQVEVNAKDYRGWTALAHAASRGDLDGAIELLNAGALPDGLGSDNNNTPLILAAKLGYDQIVDRLVHYNANLEKRDSKGNTALIAATCGCYETCLELLLDAGARPDMRNYERKTAMWYAINNVDLECLRCLVKEDASFRLAELIDQYSDLMDLRLQLRKVMDAAGFDRYSETATMCSPIDEVFRACIESFRNRLQLELCLRHDFEEGVPSDTTTVCQSRYSHVSDAYIAAQDRTNAKTLLDSLSFRHMHDRYWTVEERSQHTFGWVFDQDRTHSSDSADSNLHRWLTGGEKLFWIKGKAGSGKSTLMKYLAEHHKTTELLHQWAAGVRLVKTTYFFSSIGARSQRTELGLLRALCFGILQALPDMATTVLRSLAAEFSSDTFGQPGHHWSIAELRMLFRLLSPSRELSATKADYRLVLFVDGLDECDSDLTELFMEAIDSTSVKICASSRGWEPTLSETLPVGELFLELHEHTRGDIELYVRERLADRNIFKCADTVALNSLTSLVVEKANGVFLWVVLVVRDMLASTPLGDDVQNACCLVLESPQDIQSYFCYVLDEMDAQHRRHTLELLDLCLEARHPLSLAALRQARLVGADKIHGGSWQHLSFEQSRCLLKVDWDTCTGECVSFNHATVRDFLLQSRGGRLREKWDVSHGGIYASLSDLTHRELSIAVRERPHQIPYGRVLDILHYAKQSQEAHGMVGLHSFDLDGHLSLVLNFDPRAFGSTTDSMETLRLAPIVYVAFSAALEVYADAFTWRTLELPFANRDGARLLGVALHVGSLYQLLLAWDEQPYSEPEIDLRTVELLIEYGADPNDAIEGSSPCRSPWDMFLDSFPDPGKDPQHWAESDRRRILLDTAIILIKAGAKRVPHDHPESEDPDIVVIESPFSNDTEREVLLRAFGIEDTNHLLKIQESLAPRWHWSNSIVRNVVQQTTKKIRAALTTFLRE